jgi:hypothetical protein
MQVILAFLFFSTINCSQISINTEKNNIQVLKKDSFVFDLPDSFFFQYPYNPVLDKENSNHLIVQLSDPMGFQGLVTYDFNTRKAHDLVDLRIFSGQLTLYTAESVNPNLYALGLNPYDYPESHDYSSILVNRDKLILDTFSFRGSFLRTSANPRFKKHYWARNFCSPLLFDDKSKSILITISNCYKKDQFDFNGFWSVLGRSYLKGHSDTFVYIDYPNMDDYFKELEKVSIHRETYELNRIFCERMNDSIIILSRSLSPDFHFLNLNTNQVSFGGTMPSEYIPNNFLDLWKTDTLKAQRLKVKYSIIRYDNNRKLFYRVQHILVDSLSYREIPEPEFSISVFNQDLEKLGEVIMPNNYDWSTLVPYKEGILLSDWVLSRKTDKHVFDYFEVIEQGESAKTYADQMTELKNRLLFVDEAKEEIKDPIGYYGLFNTRTSGKDTIKYILFPINATCFDCVKDLTKSLQLLNSVEQNKLVVVFIGPDIKYVNAFLKDKSLRMNKAYHLDVEGRYRLYYEEWTNPRLISISNNRIIDDRIFGPKDMVVLKNLVSDVAEEHSKK